MSRASPRRSDGLGASLRWAVPYRYNGRFTANDQERINFPPHRDPLFGSGRVALHLLFQRHRHFGARVGRVKHNG